MDAVAEEARPGADLEHPAVDADDAEAGATGRRPDRGRRGRTPSRCWPLRSCSSLRWRRWRRRCATPMSPPTTGRCSSCRCGRSARATPPWWAPGRASGGTTPGRGRSTSWPCPTGWSPQSTVCCSGRRRSTSWSWRGVPALALRRPRAQALVVLVGLAILERGLGVAGLSDPWNPILPIIPFAPLLPPVHRDRGRTAPVDGAARRRHGLLRGPGARRLRPARPHRRRGRVRAGVLASPSRRPSRRVRAPVPCGVDCCRRRRC